MSLGLWQLRHLDDTLIIIRPDGQHMRFTCDCRIDLITQQFIAGIPGDGRGRLQDFLARKVSAKVAGISGPYEESHARDAKGPAAERLGDIFPPQKDADPVNPQHYKAHPSGVECIDVTRHMNFNRGNAMKYLWRAGSKGGAAQEIEDLKKAAWYLDDEIKRLGGLL